MEAVKVGSPRTFTVDEVLKMAERGIFEAGEPAELLWGVLYSVSPQGPFHLFMTDELGSRLRDAFPDARVLVAGPLVVDHISLPEPGLSVVRTPREALRERLPHANEAILVVELAYSSLARDRAKAKLYAHAGVPVYWLVDLQACRVEVYTNPMEDGEYGHVREVGLGGVLQLPEGRGTLPVADFMG